ncbi:MAG: N4-gp56 family major capsid protein [Oscillospiraceae bacterium]|nr:N4-gp56 family major capsid protein [Oscillospiraceae bacterium]
MRINTETERVIMILSLFAGNTNVTSDIGLSDEMKTYYSDYLIDMAEPKLVHDQFAQKHPIPKNGGKTIEFRKYSPLPKLMTPLTEGVTPDGQKLNMSVLTATVDQYGGFIELSDILLLTAIDNNMVQATKLLGSQAGRTLDTISREVLVGGTNVIYSGQKSARYQLVGGESSGNSYLTVDDVKRAVRFLKAMNAEQIDGSYVAIINQDCSYDLTNDPDWKYPHQYVDTENMYSGEIGRIAGCRFVETSEAKIFHGEDLTVKDGSDDGYRTLTVASVSTKTFTVDEKITAAQATALVGRKVVIKGYPYTIASAAAGAAGAATITVSETVSGTPGDGDIVYPGEGGAGGRDVYATLIMGADAYGTTEISGGGLQHIVKQLGSAGSADPLNQRATVGWKATKVTKRLIEEYMVRIESCSTFNDIGAN